MTGADVVLADLTEARQALDALIADKAMLEAVAAAGHLIAQSQKAGGTVMSCGNGGSLCDAMHFAEEMTGRYRQNRRPYRAQAIADASHLACVANDFGYEDVPAMCFWRSRPQARAKTLSRPRVRRAKGVSR